MSRLFLRGMVVVVGVAAFSDARAQITDVLDPILQHMTGFTVWMSHANYANDSVTGDALRYGLGIKYGPIGIGPATMAWDTTYEREIVERWDSCAHTFCKDSTLTIKIKSRQDHPIQASVTFGYNYTTSTHFDNGRGFTATFPFGGIYLAAYARVLRMGWADLLAGLQLSFYGLSETPAQYNSSSGGTSPLLMTTSTTLAPEIAVGLRFVRLIYIGASYQILKFGSIRYEAIDSTDLGAIYNQLPRELPLNSFHLGIAVTIEGSVPQREDK